MGAELEACESSNLRVEAYNPTTGVTTNLTSATAVTITSSNAAAALVSPYDTTAGKGGVIVTIPANSYFAAFCVAGQAGQSLTLTASAADLTDSGPRSVSVLQPLIGISGISTGLTASSPDEPFNVYVGIGQSTSPGVLFNTQQAREGGGGLSVTVSLPDTSVAQLKFEAQTGASVPTHLFDGVIPFAPSTLDLEEHNDDKNATQNRAACIRPGSARAVGRTTSGETVGPLDVHGAEPDLHQPGDARVRRRRQARSDHRPPDLARRHLRRAGRAVDGNLGRKRASRATRARASRHRSRRFPSRRDADALAICVRHARECFGWRTDGPSAGVDRRWSARAVGTAPTADSTG